MVWFYQKTIKNVFIFLKILSQCFLRARRQKGSINDHT